MYGLTRWRLTGVIAALFLAGGWTIAAENRDAAGRLADYRSELAAFCGKFGGARELPTVDFFLFGVGPRTKLLYKSGSLIDAVSGKIIRRWPAQSEIIVSSDYSVLITISDSRSVRGSAMRSLILRNGATLSPC